METNEQRNCCNCVHASYEENEEEVEVLVCYRFKRPITRLVQDAMGCRGYYRGTDQ